MLKYIICPDKQEVTVKECLKECRLEERCTPLAYLKSITHNKNPLTTDPTQYIPSVTQLLNGTLEEYLKLTTHFATNPQGAAFLTHGNLAHLVIENEAPESEIHLEMDGIQGTLDLIENDTLIDHKTWGAYKVAKFFGKTYNYIKREIEETEPDRFDITFQMNMYRIMYEHKYKKKIKNMKVFIIVRDGGTSNARKNKITKNLYYEKINILPDEDIINFFQAKKLLLLSALTEEKMPEKCSDKETWNGNKCKKYCSVNFACPYSNLED